MTDADTGVMPENRDGCKPQQVRNVWAVFAVGYCKHKTVLITKQLQAVDRKTAEALAAQDWWETYPNATQPPITEAQGPYIWERPMT